MPIEITELVVRANVNEQPNAKATEKNKSTTKGSKQCDHDPATAEIKQSVDTILDVLKRKNER